MARIAGVDLPKNKTVEYGLTAIYGVGLFTARKVCAQLGIDQNKKCDDLTEEEQGRFVIFSKTNTPWKVSSARRLP
jgi:Ribosomal protein S13